MIRLGVLGASGRMGEWVTRLAKTEFEKKVVLAASASEGEPLVPLLDCDAIIDFSSPAAMLALVRLALDGQRKQLPCIAVGSTGWKLDDRRELEKLAARAPVLMTSNFSIGIGILMQALKAAAPWLEKAGYLPVVVETHHHHKKDSPSGTALSLQRVISSAAPGNVQTHSIRAGEVVGDHEVTFHGPADRLVFGHFASDRSVFARGAIEVALWMATDRKHLEQVRALIGMERFFDQSSGSLK